MRYERFFPPLAGRNYVKYQAGRTFYLHTNALGSNNMSTNEAGGLVQDETFFAWGQRWKWFGSQPWDERFASLQQRDSETITWQAGSHGHGFF